MCEGGKEGDKDDGFGQNDQNPKPNESHKTMRDGSNVYYAVAEINGVKRTRTKEEITGLRKQLEIITKAMRNRKTMEESQSGTKTTQTIAQKNSNLKLGKKAKDRSPSPSNNSQDKQVESPESLAVDTELTRSETPDVDTELTRTKTPDVDTELTLGIGQSRKRKYVNIQSSPTGKRRNDKEINTDFISVNRPSRDDHYVRQIPYDRVLFPLRRQSREECYVYAELLRRQGIEGYYVNTELDPLRRPSTESSCANPRLFPLTTQIGEDNDVVSLDLFPVRKESREGNTKVFPPRRQRRDVVTLDLFPMRSERREGEVMNSGLFPATVTRQSREVKDVDTELSLGSGQSRKRKVGDTELSRGTGQSKRHKDVDASDINTELSLWTRRKQ